MRFTRLIITAVNRRWLQNAINEVCGYGSSIIACDAEVGFEGWIDPAETLDGRPGASVLLFAASTKALQKATFTRTGQCLMTCPTTAVFDGLAVGESTTDLVDFKPNEIQVGEKLRFFGDGYQKSKLIGQRRFWRIPVMDGEFICEDRVGVAKGVAGGNFLILTKDQISGLSAAEQAVDEIAKLSNVMCPFPGGVVRSGSKVGSRYQGMVASTNHPFCPTLKGIDFETTDVESNQTEKDCIQRSLLDYQVNCVYEIIIDGTGYQAVGDAMAAGIRAASSESVVSISAANYGGKLGKHQYRLYELLSSDSQTMQDKSQGAT